MITVQTPVVHVSASRVAAGTAAPVRRILDRALLLRDVPLDRLRAQAEQLRWRIRQTGRPLEALYDCFALTYEVVRQLQGLELHPCQISGGLIVARGGIAEMATGEGKTLTSVQAAALWGMSGRGMHVVTSNDYLAERDARELASIYAALGLSVGCITRRTPPEERRKAYRRDITYATASELGFDFLKDRMTLGPGSTVATHHQQDESYPLPADTPLLQRPLHAALVDEADSVLIDDARTPLVIGAESPQSTEQTALYRWCARQIPQLAAGRDFTLFPARRLALLTPAGAKRLLLSGKPRFAVRLTTDELLATSERMLEAEHFYRQDKHYSIDKGEIVLLDEATDRPLPGRKLQRGLHHCLEAKEGLKITSGSKTACQVSVQAFFRMYDHLSGMTGTARNAEQEFRRIYQLRVAPVPTHRKCQRSRFPPRIFVNNAARDFAVVDSARAFLRLNRSILIGTPSVAASHRLSTALSNAGIEHALLNAFHEAEEAEIIAAAGQPGRVTIATNIAGRGTDIRLAPTVQEAGGLHVILTEMNSSSRVDRQLVGRSARQGDPGSFQFLLSLDDELLRRLPARQREAIKQNGRPNRSGELPRSWCRLFQRIQSAQERRDSHDRTEMLRIEKQQRETCRRMGLCPYLEAIE